jgi:hypothetical protein
MNRRTRGDWPVPCSYPIGQALADEMPSDYDMCRLCGSVVFRFSRDLHMQFFHWEPEPERGFWRTLLSRVVRARWWRR